MQPQRTERFPWYWRWRWWPKLAAVFENDLHSDMIARCDDIFDVNAGAWKGTDPTEVEDLRYGCHLQSGAYHTALYTALDSLQQWVQDHGFTWSWTSAMLPSTVDAYEEAQRAADCKRLREDKEEYCRAQG